MFVKGYILDPKLVGAWQDSTPSKDTWDFFQHKFTPLKSITPIFFKFFLEKKSNLQYKTSETCCSGIQKVGKLLNCKGKSHDISESKNCFS